VRAAALSVGILMMTSGAGATPAFRGHAPNFGRVDIRMAKPAADSSVLRIEAKRPVSWISWPDPVIELSAKAGRISFQADTATQFPPDGAPAEYKASNLIVASARSGMLPFVPPRRLGPVPFE
jgi:hypothetical protein